MIDGHGLGYLRDDPDYRDWHLPRKVGPPRAFPPEFTLPLIVPTWDQQNLGSCASNGSGAVFIYVDKKQGGADVEPSRLHLYYEARAIRGWQDRDAGSYIRDNLKVLAEQGAAPEATWPYDTSKYTQKPPPVAYSEATKHQAIAYLRVDQNLEAFKECLVDGYPFVIGSTLFDNFREAAQNGMVPMPSGAKIGGHAYMVIGYRDRDRRFICQNSWGEGWGQMGRFFMPFDYLTNDSMSADPWSIRSVEEVAPPEPVPDPEARPNIRKVKQPNRYKFKVIGDGFHPDSVLWIDGDETSAAESDGHFVLKMTLDLGMHNAVVSNPNGKASVPFPFTVIE